MIVSLVTCTGAGYISLHFCLFFLLDFEYEISSSLVPTGIFQTLAIKEAYEENNIQRSYQQNFSLPQGGKTFFTSSGPRCENNI